MGIPGDTETLVPNQGIKESTALEQVTQILFCFKKVMSTLYYSLLSV